MTFDELCKKTMSKDARERGNQRARELLVEMLLAEIQELAGKSKREVAKAFGIQLPRKSKSRKLRDTDSSTLQCIVAALGGTLSAASGTSTVRDHVPPHAAEKIVRRVSPSES